MAKIPVERTSGGGASWLPWLLGLAVLALGIWGIAEWVSPDDDEVALVPPVETTEPMQQPMEQPQAMEPAPAEPAGAITDLSTLYDSTNRRALAGRSVRLDDVQVAEVVGDSVFYLAPETNVDVTPGNRVVLAGLDEVIPSSPSDVEGRYDVTEGQTVAVYGTVERIRQEDPQAWGITPQEGAQMLEQDQVYVRVQRMEIQNRSDV